MMGVVQRDYIERMIEQAVQAIAQIVELVRAGDLDPALIIVHKTRDVVLGPRRPVLERVDAASAVDLVGKYELDRLRMFAALLGEEGAIHELRGKAARAEQCYRHALELYAATSLAGARLLAADRERIMLLQPKVAAATINSRYGEELRRLAGHQPTSKGTLIDPPASGSRIGMMEPLARAFGRSVPERPKDGGLFGPRSMVWRVHRDRSFPLAAIRSLMIQALHPLAMAGVAQHSDWQRDPFGRLAATAGYVLTVTYGDTAAVDAAAARVRAVHTHVSGTDAVTGHAYRADDPELLLWVHAGMVDSIVDVVQRYGRSLDAAEADRYVAEMARFAEIIGVPATRVPASVTALRTYLESVDLRQATPAAFDAIAIVLDPPGLDDDTRELWHDLGQVAVGTLPAWARSMYGFDEPPPSAMEREPVRQLIGALDFAFESLPGVLEAREQIELRMRATP